MKLKKHDHAVPDLSKWNALVKSDVDTFIRKIRGLPQEQAEELLTSYCLHLFNSHHPAPSSLTSNLEQAKKNKELAEQRKKQISEALLNTPARLDTPPSDNKQGLLAGGWQRVRLSDAIQLALYGSLTVLSMTVSFENLSANLLGTGMQVFIDDPSKALWISLLAPAAGMAIKNLPNMFKRSSAQSLCKRCIIAVTGISALAWVALFSASFDGLSGNLPDFSDFSLEGDSKGNWLTFTQLFTEIMVSASLFSRFSDILKIYEPETKINNPEIDHLRADYSEADVTATAAGNSFAKANDALSQHEATRQAFVTEALSRLAAAQTQFRDLHQ